MLLSFISIIKRHLNKWHPELCNREEILVKLLSKLFDENDKVNNLDVNGLTIGKISEDETITSINASFIMRSTVSAKIADNDSVEIPAESIDNDVSEVTKAAKTYKTVKQDELSDLLHVLRALGTTQKVDEVNTDNITVSALVSKKANIQNSAIMRATLYKNVKE